MILHFQIAKVKKTLQEHYYRVAVLQRALQFKEMTSDERDDMEAELDAIKKLLVSQEEALKTLQNQSRKTPIIPGLFMLLCIAVFLIYTVLTNPY